MGGLVQINRGLARVRGNILGLAASLTLATFAFGPAAAEAKDSTLTLRLREVDLTHVFFVLNDLTSESFIIDAGVEGRLSVDLENAPLEKALAAVRSAGVAVGPGPLHRVSRAESPPAAAAPGPASYTGETIRVSLENVELANIVCALGGLPNWQTVKARGLGIVSRKQNPEFKVLVPRGLQGRVSLFSGYLPWDQVLDGLLAPLGLIFVFDEDGLFVGRGPEANVRSQAGAVDACQISSEPGPTSPLSENLPDLDAASLELVGLAWKDNAWKAYAYAPGRRLLSLETGQKLRDASVTDVGPTGVVFTTDEGRVVNASLRPK